MPSSLLCPSCGAEVPVRSPALPYVTCSYCQTLIRREGEGLTAVGKTAVLPFDVSPLQLGTTGHYSDWRFTIVGRVRWGWGDGSWNEWFLDCSDRRQRWLAEAMGSFTITEERPELLDLAPLHGFAAGEAIARDLSVQIDGQGYLASDIKEAVCLGSEGDLPRPTPAEAKLTNIDFRGTAGGFVSLQRDTEGASAWFGRGLELADLNPKGLRELEGWTIPASLR